MYRVNHQSRVTFISFFIVTNLFKSTVLESGSILKHHACPSKFRFFLYTVSKVSCVDIQTYFNFFFSFSKNTLSFIIIYVPIKQLQKKRGDTHLKQKIVDICLQQRDTP